MAKGPGFDAQFGRCSASLDVDVARFGSKITMRSSFCDFGVEVRFRSWRLLLVKVTSTVVSIIDHIMLLER